MGRVLQRPGHFGVGQGPRGEWPRRALQREVCWEIDNELWRSRQTDPAVYAKAVPLFTEAMKKVDPTITCIGHGGNALDRRYDQVLLDNAAASFDILSIHHYTDAPQFGNDGVRGQDGLYKMLSK